MVRRKIAYRNFLFAFIAALVLFLSGLFTGQQLTSWQVENIKRFEEDLRTSLTSLELRQTLLKQNICGISDLGQFSAELSDLGKQLANLESRYGKGDNRILELKEPYFLLEIRHYLLMQEAASRCGRDFDLILYFYSNDPKQCEECDNQGYILSYLQEKLGYDQVKMYSFDIRSSSPAVQTLVELHHVKNAPLTVVNGVRYDKFIALEEIEKLLS
ncbi:hypothetical protein A2V68_01105 [candidate division Kazan bacterium RBG_13_50_9]|uniref:Thioredoxin-like fold domain-containing protein n=1 Tax=candidate division Kazan bacterium RBG_13_50_9 TaxID=1798535 RepID=A0A1F4NSI9_UNCK3|nr:MAG: hypothetical protein A2V68_01105 [candidate division Kazan bacterium RBG_13_50_9]